jgi:hypothetical protein
LSSNVEEP